MKAIQENCFQELMKYQTYITFTKRLHKIKIAIQLYREFYERNQYSEIRVMKPTF